MVEERRHHSLPPSAQLVSVLIVGLSYGGSNVLSYNGRMMQNFPAFRESHYNSIKTPARPSVIIGRQAHHIAPSRHHRTTVLNCKCLRSLSRHHVRGEREGRKEGTAGEEIHLEIIAMHADGRQECTSHEAHSEDESN